jgi:uncharacterized protein YegJ (DUF2314 family)
MTSCTNFLSLKALTALMLTGAVFNAAGQAASASSQAPNNGAGNASSQQAQTGEQKSVLAPLDVEAPDIKRAIAEAQRTLNQFLKDTDGRNPNLDKVGVRARFTSGPFSEYLWVMPVETADGKSFGGQLNDIPLRIQNMVLAQEVKFKREDIVDCMYVDTKKKVMQGHYITCTQMKNSPPTELAAMKKRYGLDCAARLKRLR